LAGLDLDRLVLEAGADQAVVIGAALFVIVKVQ
jgi:hypothetical protein